MTDALTRWRQETPEAFKRIAAEAGLGDVEPFALGGGVAVWMQGPKQARFFHLLKDAGFDVIKGSDYIKAKPS